MAQIYRGEASESEDEPTTSFNTLPQDDMLKSLVMGEASESEEETFDKASINKSQYPLRNQEMYKSSLLRMKLVEGNVAIWRNLHNYIKDMVSGANKQLIKANQLLIKSEVSLQSVVSSLHVAQSNIKQLHAKSNNIFTAEFLPKELLTHR